MIIELTKQEAVCLSDYFESDLPYYNGGLDILKLVLDKVDSEDEYKESLKHYNLPENTSKEDLKLKYDNTKDLVDVMSKIVDMIKKELDKEEDDSNDVKFTVV